MTSADSADLSQGANANGAANISNEEMIRILGGNQTGEQRVEMGKGGIFLKVKEGSFPISLAQADALFTTMFGRAAR